MNKVFIVVGHSEYRKGARNIELDMSEFDYNKQLAMIMNRKIANIDSLDSEIVYRTTSYKGLIPAINNNSNRGDIVVSLHCNAFNSKASGSEVLYYENSKKGSLLAKHMQFAAVRTLGLNDRGVKPRSIRDRGGYLLKYTDCPCVITEPFFIDNTTDLRIGVEYIIELADNYVTAISNYYKQ